jgi:hypothetical protein
MKKGTYLKTDAGAFISVIDAEAEIGLSLLICTHNGLKGIVNLHRGQNGQATFFVLGF